MRLGFAELPILLIVVVTWAVPIVAAIWVLFTLNRIAKDGAASRQKLEAIEQLLKESRRQVP